MKIAVFGTGYVGLVTGACLADVGHQVTCIDTKEERVEQLLAGDIPIYEPGLESLVRRNQKEKRLIFTTNPKLAIEGNEAIFIAVGTPSTQEGQADMQYVDKVAHTIGKGIRNYVLVINKSTVPVGTSNRVSNIIAQELSQRRLTIEYDVASNPEFLKEGSAIQDFLRPDRIIIGCDTKRAEQMLRQIYSPYNRNHEKIISMDSASAELTKYAANSMLASRITFINQLAAIAEATGANIENIRRGIGSDKRIGYDFLYAGLGYGGSCFPKDVRALIATAKSHNLDASMLESIDKLNHSHKTTLSRKIYQHYDGKVKNKVLAVWGLSFKANTDDIREAASLELINWALEEGLKLRLYDPKAQEAAKEIYGNRAEITWCKNRWHCLEGANALAICTEWQEFKEPDFQRIADLLQDKVIFDGRNIYIYKDFKKYALTGYFVGLKPTGN